MTKRPNVDLGLGALTFVAGLPDDIAPFAVARIAGFAAHLQEELEERPVRYPRPGPRHAPEPGRVRCPDPGCTCNQDPDQTVRPGEDQATLRSASGMA